MLEYMWLHRSGLKIILKIDINNSEMIKYAYVGQFSFLQVDSNLFLSLSLSLSPLLVRNDFPLEMQKYFKLQIFRPLKVEVIPW